MTNSAHLTSGVLAAVLARRPFMRCGTRSSRARATNSSLRRSSRSGAAWPLSWRLSSCRGRRARPCPSSSPRRSSISSIFCWSDGSIAAPISRSPIRSCAGSRPLIAAVSRLLRWAKRRGRSPASASPARRGRAGDGRERPCAWANRPADDRRRAGQFGRHRDLFGDRRGRREDFGRGRGLRLRL